MTAQSDNPHDLCTWRPEAACAGCELGERLQCRFKVGDLLYFIWNFAAFAIPAVIGVFRGGYGPYLWGWAAFCLFFFEVWEIRILCSHCPYYARSGSAIRCPANYGSLKLWKYRPGPISTSEKVQLLIGFAILGGYPFPFLLLGKQFAWAAVAAWTLVAFFWSLRKHICTRCVNFSCLLNAVPEEVVEAYLERNPVMREAWKER